MNAPTSLKLRPRPDAPSTATNDMAARRQQLLARTCAPPSPVPVRQEVAIVAHQEIPIALAIEASIIATLTRPLRPGENHQSGNANREAELQGVFATLDALQSAELLRRLDLDRPDDALARAFGRIVIERRTRLRAFLADTRRRQALGGT